MALVGKEYVFEAAHQLPNHRGKCAQLHGHSYKVAVYVEGPIINDPGASDDGFVVDFGDLSDVMKPLIEKYCDHKFLNETLTSIRRTTAELIACWFYGAVQKHLPPNLTIDYIEVRETATSSAVAYQEDWLAAGKPGLETTLD